MNVVTATEEDLRLLTRKLEENNRVGFDTEVTSDHPHKDAVFHWDKMDIAGYSFGFPDGCSTYVPIRHEIGPVANRSTALSLLQKVVEDRAKTIVAHNAKYEISVLGSLGFEWLGTKEDSMIAVWLLNKGLGGGEYGFKLKQLIYKYRKHKMTEWHEVVPEGMRCHQISSLEVAPYAADDAVQALWLMDWAQPQMTSLGLDRDFVELEMPFLDVVRHMEDVGSALDEEFLENYRVELKTEVDNLVLEWDDLVGCSIGSSQQLSKAMYDDKKWWPILDKFERGKNGFYSTNTGHREQVAKKLKKGSPGRRAMELKNRHARLSKIITTYTTSLITKAHDWDDNRLRASWKQHGTVTGRLSCSVPNLQQIPIRTPEGAKIRQAFIAEEGWQLGVADESQFELRLMAHFSQDPMLMKAYREGIDLHQQTADATGTDRAGGKVTNLGLIYEMSDYRLAQNLDITHNQAKPIHRSWHKLYNRVAAYQRQQHNRARKYGYVRTLSGRIRLIDPVINSEADGDRGKRMFWERASSNTPCQGSAADIMKIAMRNLYREWKDRGVLYDVRKKTGKAKMCMQIHDELVNEFRDDFAEEGFADTIRHLENAVELSVPLKADGSLGKNWLEAK